MRYIILIDFTNVNSSYITVYGKKNMETYVKNLKNNPLISACRVLQLGDEVMKWERE